MKHFLIIFTMTLSFSSYATSTKCEGLSHLEGSYSIEGKDALTLEVEGCNVYGLGDNDPIVFDGIQREGQSLAEIVDFDNDSVTVRMTDKNESGSSYSYTADGERYIYYTSNLILSVDRWGTLSIEITAQDEDGKSLDERIIKSDNPEKYSKIYESLPTTKLGRYLGSKLFDILN